MARKKENNRLYSLGIYITVVFIILLIFIYKNDVKNRNEITFINNYHSNLEKINEIYFKEYKKVMENNLNYLSKKIIYEKLNDENYRNELLNSWKDLKSYNNYINWVYLGYDENSILIDKFWKKPENFNLKSREWYKEGIKSERIFWSDPYLDNDNKNIIVTLTKKVKNSKGETKGVLSFDADLNKISEMIRSLDFSKENFVYNKNYKIIAHSNPNFLNNDLENTAILKKIQGNDKSYFYDSEKNVYVFYKNSFGWTLVSKIPRENLNALNKNENTIYFYFIGLMMVALIHILYVVKNRDKNFVLIDLLKAIQNREDLESVFLEKKNREESSVINELYNIQKMVEVLEKEILRDEETGLYNEIYLSNYAKVLSKKSQKILIIKYLNLSELKNQYGKNVVELVLKRGAMTLNALKEADEQAIRIDKDSIALILNNGDINQRANYIVDEILTYKWKLHNINLSIAPTLLRFEDYQKLGG